VALGGGPEPWRLEPWWALLRRGDGFVLRCGEYPSGTFSAAAALTLAGGGGTERRLALAGGGLLPLDRGAVFILDLPLPQRVEPVDR
jgi:hypothetical protein